MNSLSLSGLYLGQEKKDEHSTTEKWRPITWSDMSRFFQRTIEFKFGKKTHEDMYPACQKRDMNVGDNYGMV